MVAAVFFSFKAGKSKAETSRCCMLLTSASLAKVRPRRQSKRGVEGKVEVELVAEMCVSNAVQSSAFRLMPMTYNEVWRSTCDVGAGSFRRQTWSQVLAECHLSRCCV
ncbi:MAG: hypothetical protein ACKESB_00965 [Candidatus Hodgkinia cicadicola]